jgi:putative hemolysin
VLKEIGRLREIAFRAVGEGTGRAVDLDRFDDWYQHLFIWNDRDNEVIGAYRMAQTDRVVRRQGLSGLYTRTLFWYQHSLLDAIGPALELGRSFVRLEHQRSFGPLMLLWKGIGRYVARHPRYRMLFGPVSISNDYHSMSRQLLVRFLRDNRYLEALARLVKPRNPPRFRRSDLDARFTTRIVSDLEEVDELVREIEAQQRSIPVLLRQYLKLNGMLLGFNVDPQFGHVVDGLVLIDLTRVDRRILEHYMGREQAARFLMHHQAILPPAPTALAG